MTFFDWFGSLLMTGILMWAGMAAAFGLAMIFGRNMGLEDLPRLVHFVIAGATAGFLFALRFVWGVDLLPFI